MILAVAGCVAQAEGAEILARAPYVDIVLGPQTYHRLPEMVARAPAPAGAVIETDFPAEDKFDFLPDAAAPQGITAFLTIQEGCDKFCSFCVVPYTRGAETEPPRGRGARRGAAAGRRRARARSRCSGRTSTPGTARRPDGGTWGLGRLLRELAELPGLLRLRYTTSHPRDMDDELIAAHRDLPTLMPFLHLPVQSGSDRVLAAMNRRHTRGRLPAPGRAAARGAAGPRAVVRLHRRPSRRDRGRLRRRRWRWSARSASPRPSASNIRPAPARRPPARPARCRRPRRIAGCRRCRRCCATSRPRSTPAASG